MGSFVLQQISLPEFYCSFPVIFVIQPGRCLFSLVAINLNISKGKLVKVQRTSLVVLRWD